MNDREKLNPEQRSVAVIGGGLAGIAAAVRLASRGARVTVVETRKRLGGRASSFVDPASGRVLDNCQHVLMGCCTNLIDLYKRLGVADRIRWHRRLYFSDSNGTIDSLEGDDLPPPLHMTRALMGFKALSLAEKLAIVRGMMAIIRLGKQGRERLTGVSFAKWLGSQRQPEGAVKKFWSVIAISALNELPERVEAAYAIQVFQEGFLTNEQGYVMGVPNVPLIELYESAERVIRAAGGTVLFSSSAEEFVLEDGRVRAVKLSDGAEIGADAFVSAVPFDRLARMSTPAMVRADPRLEALKQIRVSPIIGIHMWFTRGSDEDTTLMYGEDGRAAQPLPVMELPHVILIDSPLQWIFNKGYDPVTGGQHLHGVISAAHDLVDCPAEQIIETAVREVHRAIPNSRGGRVLHARVVKERRATFSAAPGIDSIRPTAAGQIENLFLAGDWCRTGWPATMEGAVRSGYLAAAAAGGGQSREAGRPVVADLPAGSLYRLFSGEAAGPAEVW